MYLSDTEYVNDSKVDNFINNNNNKPKNNEINEDLFVSPHLRSASDLDNDINQILNSKLDDNDKAKLYTNALEKYLFHRYKYLNPKKYLESMPQFEQNQLSKNLRIKNKIKKKNKLRKILPKKAKNPKKTINIDDRKSDSDSLGEENESVAPISSIKRRLRTPHKIIPKSIRSPKKRETKIKAKEKIRKISNYEQKSGGKGETYWLKF